MSQSRNYAATVLPLITELRSTKAYKGYLLPKIQKVIDDNSNDVHNNEELTPDQREKARAVYLAFKSFKESFNNDLEMNKLQLAD